MRAHLDHDIRVWLTAEEYLGALHAAESSDRTLSGYVRHLLRQDLSLQASALMRADPSAEPGPPRDAEGHHGG